MSKTFKLIYCSFFFLFATRSVLFGMRISNHVRTVLRVNAVLLCAMMPVIHLCKLGCAAIFIPHLADERCVHGYRSCL